eukprot:2004248-Alexandrium_andersonii.AAC.1
MARPFACRGSRAWVPAGKHRAAHRVRVAVAHIVFGSGADTAAAPCSGPSGHRRGGAPPRMVPTCPAARHLRLWRLSLHRSWCWSAYDGSPCSGPSGH